MRWPGAIGTIVVHGLVVGLALFSWSSPDRDTPPVSSVPVSVISETLIEAAPADNPSEELIEAPLETSEPTPPPSASELTPPPSTPRPTPTPQPTQKTQTRPPQKTQPRREERGLDLGSLRPSERPSRPATGDRGQGQAPRAIGPLQLQALAREVSEYWIPPCGIPGGDSLTVRVRVRLSDSGHVIGRPTFDDPRTDSLWRAASQSMANAIARAEPFDVPEGFMAQEVPFRFETAAVCN